jgi:hypothetical protein
MVVKICLFIRECKRQNHRREPSSEVGGKAMPTAKVQELNGLGAFLFLYTRHREIREIREIGKLSREGSGFFACFAYFAVERIP